MAAMIVRERARRLFLQIVVLLLFAFASLVVYGLAAFLFGHRDLYRIKIVNTRIEPIQISGTKGEDTEICKSKTSLDWPKRYYRPLSEVPIVATTAQGNRIRPLRTERRDHVFVSEPQLIVYY